MKVSIIGFGLIGGSIALNIKRRKPNSFIVAVDPEKKNLDYGVREGFLDVPRGTIVEDLKGSDFVVICTHLLVYPEVSQRLAEVLNGEELVIDVGSVKGWVVTKIKPIFDKKGIPFVASHPIAGTEKSGAENSVYNLFDGAKCIITPFNNQPRELDKARKFWEFLGSKVEFMDPFEHDAIFAQVSHLPHLIAYALVDHVLSTEGGKALEYAGGGFRDFTRIAASSAYMWRDIFELNRENVLEDLERFIKALKEYRDIIKEKRWKELEERIDKVSKIRASLFN